MIVTSAITALIANRALCRECIAGGTNMKPEAVDEAVKALSRAVKVDRYPNGTCVECGEETLVFAIDRTPPR